MEKSETGRQWLAQLLEMLGSPAPIEASMLDDQSSCILTIDHSHLRPHQIQALIGTDGVSIDAIQHLANSCLNSQGVFYQIEINGYRRERLQVLEQIAQVAIAHVTSTKTNYEIKNLSASERRQLHILFEDYPDLETFSEGKEPHRYLVVRPK